MNDSTIPAGGWPPPLPPPVPVPVPVPPVPPPLPPPEDREPPFPPPQFVRKTAIDRTKIKSTICFIPAPFVLMFVLRSVIVTNIYSNRYAAGGINHRASITS
ncbi:MAG: hypothetical protein E3J72_16780 [Planctomycetota bacterium]|nr:MAG: hypothetical protein E3J72_16780 [Planctomycetota bacterium]